MPSPWNTSSISITTSNGTVLTTTKRFYDISPSKVTFSFTKYTYVDYERASTSITSDPSSNTLTFLYTFGATGNSSLPVSVTVPKTSLSPSSEQYVS